MLTDRVSPSCSTCLRRWNWLASSDIESSEPAEVGTVAEAAELVPMCTRGESWNKHTAPESKKCTELFLRGVSILEEGEEKEEKEEKEEDCHSTR